MKEEKLNEQLIEITENGKAISPILPEGVKNYLIDIDLSKPDENNKKLL